jgi:hypothetical protein
MLKRFGRRRKETGSGGRRENGSAVCPRGLQPRLYFPSFRMFRLIVFPGLFVGRPRACSLFGSAAGVSPVSLPVRKFAGRRPFVPGSRRGALAVAGVALAGGALGFAAFRPRPRAAVCLVCGDPAALHRSDDCPLRCSFSGCNEWHRREAHECLVCRASPADHLSAHCPHRCSVRGCSSGHLTEEHRRLWPR